MTATLKIGAVVEETGVSRELIHHYLRQGLLPPSTAKARYDDQQVRLLRQIRALRDEHHLPLDVIRRIFTLLDFDPARLELLTCTESLSRRIERVAGEGSLGAAELLSTSELLDSTGISAERLAEYRRADLVTPIVDSSVTAGGEPGRASGEERYCAYSARAIVLCERGIALGVPFDSLRTVASHVSLAYELEHAEFLVLPEQSVDGDRLVADLFVRSELAGAFVQNVLGALMTRRLRAAAATPRAAATFDRLVYRPSEAFVARHGLERHIHAARAMVGERPHEAQGWSRAATLLLHAGRYREAAFFLEQALRRWPLDRALRGALGRALLLLGDHERGRAALARAGGEHDPCAAILLALADFQRAMAADQPEVLLREAVPIRERVERALDASRAADDPARVEAAIFGGWLLAALPPLIAEARADDDKGRALLADTLGELDDGALAEREPAGLRDRQRINCAYLLLERGGARGDGAGSDELAALICRLDPGSAFAETAYLGAFNTA